MAGPLKGGAMVAGNINSLLNGGADLITGEADALGIDFTFATLSQQMRVTTSSVAVDSDPSTKLTYTSPSAKLTRRASGTWTLTNGTTELPYEWDVNGNPQGILIEEARTNQELRSQEFDDAHWVKGNCTVTANAVAAPDGTTTADKLVEDTTTNNHILDSRNVPKGSTGQTVTASVFVKAGERTWAYLSCGDWTASGHSTWINLTTGALGTGDVGGIYTVTNAGNGWWRVTSTHTIVGTFAYLALTMGTADTVSSYLGDGASGVYFWGAQIELGDFATSYIATTSASVTRNKDQLTLATSAYPHSDSVGTIVVAAKMTNASALAYQIALSVDDGTTSERQIIYKDNASSALVGQTQDGGVGQSSLALGNVVAGTAFKAAMAWTLNDMAGVLNAGTVQTDGAGTMPTITSMKFGQNADTTLQLNGYLRQVTYLKRRATNGELQTRTT